MYSAPPKGATRNDTREENTDAVAVEDDDKWADEQITPGTDANWTGAVPADD
ncbi:hypothetical protein ACFFQF_06755 [Haladaptatus pallidirubidus]|uniref:Uncharacterized protein n=1 Tax=Haladaptatus pallidirubidus TaxID=1008152 RepID=A0AAV3UM74_9EURY|nr:hypothetical protein [Haladaptatus pallidirubidus]